MKLDLGWKVYLMDRLLDAWFDSIRLQHPIPNRALFERLWPRRWHRPLLNAIRAQLEHQLRKNP